MGHHHRDLVNYYYQNRGASVSVETTTPGETLTINSLGVSEETTVFWGDGQSDSYTGTAQRTHVYASPGTYNIRIDKPLAVTTLDLRDAKLTVNSRDLRGMVNMDTFQLFGPAGGSGRFDSADVASWSPTTFLLTSMPSGYAGTFDSADVASWSPTTFVLNAMPSGYAGTFDSADVASWSPSNFQLSSMPSGYAGTFDSADVASWSPTTFRLNGMPGFTSWTFGDTDFNGWTTTTAFFIDDNGLTQAQVDTILFSIYGIGVSRTASGGTINVAGTNAAPSGTFQAAVSCPVDTNTPGKETAHELLNDGCLVGFNVWDTVTFTA